MYAKYGKQPSQNDIMHTFYYFDKDRSGQLDFTEFKHLLKYLSGVPSSSYSY
jgi:Ca2+-binding EF-hand superfamily protein